MYLVWLSYFYLAMALRENVLVVNGSHIRPWWITHHYISAAASLALLGLPITSPCRCGALGVRDRGIGDKWSRAQHGFLIPYTGLPTTVRVGTRETQGVLPTSRLLVPASSFSLPSLHRVRVKMGGRLPPSTHLTSVPFIRLVVLCTTAIPKILTHTLSITH